MLFASKPTKSGSRGRRSAVLLVMLMLTLMTTGCLYPDEKNEAKAINYRDSVSRIQAAVDAYQADKGLLPILNANEDTPRYEKFRIDLSKLEQNGYLDEIPSTAFEKGGNAYFLILDEELKPTVKVLDLITMQKVTDVQRAVDRYKISNKGALPSINEIYPGLFEVDLKKAGVTNSSLKSVYSGQEVAFLMDKQGKVYVDYAFDIMQLIDKEKIQPQPDEDLRVYLEQSSYYVPVKSLPYQWKDGSPVAVSEMEG